MPFALNPLSQKDPRWKNEQLGFDNTLTIGTDGCALTCLTMLVNGYGFSETPSTINKKLKDMGPGVGYMGGLIIWGALSRAFPRVTYQRIILCTDQPAPVADINSSLDAAQPVIVQVDRSPSPGLQSHWVILYARQGQDYLMLDPWPNPPDAGPVTLISRYGFNRPPAEFITAAVWYHSQLPPPPPLAPGFYVQVPLDMASGLNLRESASTGAQITALEPAGTYLLSLESAEAVQSKIGVSGQWINVRDPQGRSGFVAAWYVQIYPNPTPSSGSPGLPLDSNPLTVFVSLSAEPTGLRLREQPNLSSTVIAVEDAGTPLRVLEEKESALKKVGVQDQWLNVGDSRGKTGYVAAWYVQVSAASTPPPAVPDPGDQVLCVSVSSQASAGLRLRSEPNENAATEKVLEAGTSLTVLEAAQSARKKIGVEDQWLYVRDPSGMSGYVAAWFVQTS